MISIVPRLCRARAWTGLLVALCCTACPSGEPVTSTCGVVGREDGCPCSAGTGVRVCELSGQWGECSCRRGITALDAAADAASDEESDAGDSGAVGDADSGGEDQPSDAGDSASAGRSAGAAGASGAAGTAGSGAAGRSGRPRSGSGTPPEPQPAVPDYGACQRSRECRGDARQCFQPRDGSDDPTRRGFCSASCDADEQCPAAPGSNARQVCRERSCLLDCRDTDARCPPDMQCRELSEGDTSGSFCVHAG